MTIWIPQVLRTCFLLEVGKSHKWKISAVTLLFRLGAIWRSGSILAETWFRAKVRKTWLSCCHLPVLGEGGTAEAWGLGRRAAVVRPSTTSWETCVPNWVHCSGRKKHQCCLMQVPMVVMSEPIKALFSTKVDSRPLRAMNPDGGGAAVCLFAVSPVQALTSSHPFLTSLYMFLILLGGQRSCYCRSLPVLLHRSERCRAARSKAASSLLSLPSAELQQHW